MDPFFMFPFLARNPVGTPPCLDPYDAAFHLTPGLPHASIHNLNANPGKGAKRQSCRKRFCICTTLASAVVARGLEDPLCWDPQSLRSPPWMQPAGPVCWLVHYDASD